MLLVRHKRKDFLHRIVTSDEKWIHYDNPKKRKSWGSPSHTSTSIEPSRIFMEKNSCCVFGGISLVSCIMSCKPNETWGSLPNTIDEIKPSTQGKTHYYSRHDKIILLQDNTRPHVAAGQNLLRNTQMEVLPHLPCSSDIAPSDYYLFRSMTHCLSEQYFTSYEDTKNCR